MKKIFLLCFVFIIVNLYADVNIRVTDSSGNFSYVTLPGDLVEGENRFYLDVEDTTSGMFGSNFCAIYPEYPVVCNDIDGDFYDDCDGTIGDGLPIDCDDSNELVNPGLGEICNDGIDNNCDGLIDMLDPVCQAIGTIPSDYVAYWAMNYNSSGFILDQSQNNLDLTLHGVTYIESGVNNNAFDLNGSGYMKRESSLLFQGMPELTVSVWAKKNTTSSVGYLVSKHLHYQISILSSSIRAYIVNSSGIQTVLSVGYGASLINDTDWHLYTLTYDGSTVRFYFDGVEIDSDNLTGDIKSDSSRDFYVGIKYDGHSLLFNGLVDEVYLYDRVLDYDEVQLLLTMPTGLDGTPPEFISNKSVILSNNFALVKFSTNEATTGNLEFCTGANCLTIYFTNPSTNHVMALSSLVPYGEYVYTISAYDESGNNRISQPKEFILNDVYLINRYAIDNQWTSITQDCIDTIRDKNVLLGSRSWGPYMVNGIQDIDPLYTYDRKELDHAEEFLSIVFDDFEMAHFMNESWPFDLRWIHLDEYIRGRAGIIGIDVALQMMYGTSNNTPPADAETMFNEYTEQIDQLLIDYPYVKIIMFTHHVDTRELDSIWNLYADEYSTWIKDKYSGILPIIDIHDIMSTRENDSNICQWWDGPVLRRKMCLEYNSGDFVHPNTSLAMSELAKAYYLAMSKLYCE